MNGPEEETDVMRDMSREEIMSALFAHMVMQQSSMAMMLLGKAAHPETGQIVRDLEAAKLFIDQLEMLEAKTKGNLTAPEAAAPLVGPPAVPPLAFFTTIGFLGVL